MVGSLSTPRFSGNLIGIALIIAATLVMILQHSLVKALAAEMSILKIVFFRTATDVLFFCRGCCVRAWRFSGRNGSACMSWGRHFRLSPRSGSFSGSPSCNWRPLRPCI
ncbi:MAG: hypothetical protein ACPGQV_21375 [Alphaproteobacteria bacterium]